MFVAASLVTSSIRKAKVSRNQALQNQHRMAKQMEKQTQQHHAFVVEMNMCCEVETTITISIPIPIPITVAITIIRV